MIVADPDAESKWAERWGGNKSRRSSMIGSVGPEKDSNSDAPAETSICALFELNYGCTQEGGVEELDQAASGRFSALMRS